MRRGDPVVPGTPPPKRKSMVGWPFTSQPTGWFMVCWSWELAPGEVKPIELFGRDLVVYRTESGVANVMDAYCPHVGGHLGYGGCVVGESIKCPWHGWEWDVEGRNVCIPFVDHVNTKVRAEPWPVREKDYCILVWHDAKGREPFWEWPGIPEFNDPEGFYQPQEHPMGAVLYGALRVKPQLPLENAADLMHFPSVHGAYEPATHTIFETADHYMHVGFKMLFGGGRQSSWLTPDGQMYGTVEGEVWGLGLQLARFELEGLQTAQFITCSPIDDDYCWVWSTIASTRDAKHPDKPGGRSAMMTEAQVAQVRSDFHVWEHQRYMQHPQFLNPQERNYAKVRQWVRQFYPDAVDADQAAAGE